jgi:hypothetical protein
MDTICFRVHAGTVRDDAPAGLWEDTAAKLLLLAAAEIEELTERLEFETRRED